MSVATAYPLDVERVAITRRIRRILRRTARRAGWSRVRIYCACRLPRQPDLYTFAVPLTGEAGVRQKPLRDNAPYVELLLQRLQFAAKLTRARKTYLHR